MATRSKDKSAEDLPDAATPPAATERTETMVREEDGHEVACKPMHVPAWEAQGYKRKEGK